MDKDFRPALPAEPVHCNKRFARYMAAARRQSMQSLYANKTICIELNHRFYIIYIWFKSLPKAHTCFNQLVLPRYASLEILQQKLKYAIQNTDGFQMS